jgi:hypothetical protein
MSLKRPVWLLGLAVLGMTFGVGAARADDLRVAGGLVTYTTSVTGLRFTASAYDQWVENQTTSALHEQKRTLQCADYTNGPLDLKIRYGEHSLFGVDSRTYYLQVGYTFWGKWTPFLRYDDVITNDALGSDGSYFQRTLVTGIGYRIDEHISVRLENHFSHGYALAVASNEDVPGALNWNMTVASVAFAF